MPSKSLRAVRTTPERSTAGGDVVVSSSTSTWSAPLGCSMLSRWFPGVVTARSLPTAPGSMTAVATLTAPSTPMDSCTRTGMKVRVLIVPPGAFGGATSEILGTVVPLTSPSPIALPASRRSSWTRLFSSSSPSSSAIDS